MNTYSLTWRILWAFLAIVLAIALYDIWPALTPERGDTISEIMAGLPRIVVLGIGVALGALAAHFWWVNPRWVDWKIEKLIAQGELKRVEEDEPIS